MPRDALKSGAGAWHKAQAAQPTTNCPPSRHCPDRFGSTPSCGFKDIKLPELTALDTLLSSSSFRQLSVILCRGCLSNSTSHSFPSFSFDFPRILCFLISFLPLCDLSQFC
ncbi:hypothetical protein VTJ04DRAFT_4930 [Mycothermus thermophilus]|uniref:uncharacterized protein n=1 Tax=Humicola insolens TaxID=85995 RepID=UPI003742D1F5